MAQLVELHALLPPERKADTVILAVSPDPPDKFREVIPKVAARTGQDFAVTLLNDFDQRVIRQYGLLNEEAARKGRFLPHPTTYLIDPKGLVRWKFTEVNYRIRPSNKLILEELGRIE